MFALSLTVYEIFANQEKCQNFDLENEGHGQDIEKPYYRNSTRNIRIHTGDFFQNFSYVATYVYAKGYIYTHLHTLTRTQRETGVMTIGKICKADLPQK